MFTMQSVFLLLFFSRQNLFFQFLRLTCNSIFRVEEYITSGRDKTIVDPEPTGLYTKRKQQIADSLNTDPVAKVDVVNYPESGWGNSLEKMPMFTRAEMNEHIARSGKNIGNIHHHSVPTTLRKAKTFLEDEYLHEIMATCDEHCFYFKAKCCHSYRKNDPPHQLKLALCIVKGDVLNSTCTCVAGKVGFCNHTSALMLKLCKFSLYEAKTTRDLQKDADENPQVACTSQLQSWNKKGGGENIVAQPVMEVVVKKAKLDEPSTSRCGGGVKCLLYEARRQPQHDLEREKAFKSELSGIDQNLGFAHMNKEKNLAFELSDTKFGKSPVGSFLSYQTSFTESNFSAQANLASVQGVDDVALDLTHYPRFPMTNEEDMTTPRELSDSEKNLLSTLNVDEDKIHEIESKQGINQHLKCGSKNAPIDLLPLTSKRLPRGKGIMIPMHSPSCTQSHFPQNMLPMALSMNPSLFKSIRNSCSTRKHQ